jgi:hypothetical protein
METAVLAQGAHTFSNSLTCSVWSQPELQHCKHASSPLPSRLAQWLAQYARASDRAQALSSPASRAATPELVPGPLTPDRRYTHDDNQADHRQGDAGRTVACAAHSACSSTPSGERSRNASRNAGACGPCRRLRSSPRPAHVARVIAAATASSTATPYAVLDCLAFVTVCACCCCCIALGLTVPPLSHISHCAVLALQDLQSLLQHFATRCSSPAEVQ